MAEENAGGEDRTEAPTQRRLDEARRKGRSAASAELPQAAALIGATLGFAVGLPLALPSLIATLRAPFGEALALDAWPTLAARLFTDAMLLLLAVMLPAALLALGAGLVQTGFLVSAEPLKPQWNRISPLAGLKRIVSLDALVGHLRVLVKVAVLAGATWLALAPLYPQLGEMAHWSPAALMAATGRAALRLLLALSVALAAIAALDVLYQRLRFAQRQRMTRTELREEMRQSEGDPKIKGRLRQIRMERARRRMLAAVPKADVVITNPTHYAVALAYQADRMGAPRVVAKGVDLLAARIREAAARHEIPLVANPPLARALYSVELEREIPPEHYRAVAEIIAFVWRLKGRSAHAPA